MRLAMGIFSWSPVSTWVSPIHLSRVNSDITELNQGSNRHNLATRCGVNDAIWLLWAPHVEGMKETHFLSDDARCLMLWQSWMLCLWESRGNSDWGKPHRRHLTEKWTLEWAWQEDKDWGRAFQIDRTMNKGAEVGWAYDQIERNKS